MSSVSLMTSLLTEDCCRFLPPQHRTLDHQLFEDVSVAQQDPLMTQNANVVDLEYRRHGAGRHSDTSGQDPSDPCLSDLMSHDVITVACTRQRTACVNRSRGATVQTDLITARFCGTERVSLQLTTLFTRLATVLFKICISLILPDIFHSLCTQKRGILQRFHNICELLVWRRQALDGAWPRTSKWGKKVSHYCIISEIDFFVKLKYRSRFIMLSLSNKYSMRDLISGVNYAICVI